MYSILYRIHGIIDKLNIWRFALKMAIGEISIWRF